jgi:hypothetical protein
VRRGALGRAGGGGGGGEARAGNAAGIVDGDGAVGGGGAPEEGLVVEAGEVLLGGGDAEADEERPARGGGPGLELLERVAARGEPGAPRWRRRLGQRSRRDCLAGEESGLKRIPDGTLNNWPMAEAVKCLILQG